MSTHLPSRMTVMYGGAPDPYEPLAPRPYPDLIPSVPIVTRSSVFPKRKATVAARVDTEGRLWLRLSVDGVLVAEVESDPSGATITVDV